MKKLFFLLIMSLMSISSVSFALVSDISPKSALYQCDGATTEFAFVFTVQLSTDIDVVIVDSSNTETQLTPGADFTVSLNANNTGSITTTTTYSSAYQLMVSRATPETQDLDLQEGGYFSAEALEDALDKAIMVTQQNTEKLSRAALLPSTNLDTLSFPTPSANKSLCWDESASALTNCDTSTATSTVFDHIGNYDSLADALSDIGAAVTTLVIDVETIIADGTSVTIPSTLSLFFINGGSVDGVAGGGIETLNINGPLEAGAYEIFGSNLTVSGSPIAEFGLCEWFGGAADASTDNTIPIDRATDLDIKIKLLQGIYLADKVVIKDHMDMAGNRANTILRANTSSETSFFQLDPGHVRTIVMEDFQVQGGDGAPNNSGQWAGILTSDLGSGVDGGIFYGTFRNIRFLYFDNGLDFSAGGNSYKLPHQFITLDQVQVFRTLSTGNSLKLTGQCEHFLFLNCVFDGVEKGTGTNIIFDYNTHGTGSIRPSKNTFIQLTSQRAETAINFLAASDISILDSWFESLDKAIILNSVAVNINIEKNRFANAGYNVGGTGFILSVGSSSNASFTNNAMVGTYDKVIEADVNNLGVISDNNRLAGTLTGNISSGITTFLSVSSNTITVNQNKEYYVNASASVINTIIDEKLPGESIFLKAHNGSITIGNTGNIIIGHLSEETVIHSRSTVQLVKTDAEDKWLFVQSIATFEGELVWDPISLSDGSGVTSPAISLADVVFGDYVIVSAPYDLQGIIATAYSITSGVRIRLQNETGGVIDLANGTWKVKVIK